MTDAQNLDCVEAGADEAPLVSVIVPHYDDPESLDRCLAALETQTLDRSAFEVVVADNASPQGVDCISAVIAGRARLTLVPQKGAGPARNGGVLAARGRILAFTDCDCVPEPEWLEAGLAALEGSGVVGGRVRVMVRQPSKLSPVEAFEMVFAFDNRSYVLRKGFTVTANLFCRRDVFDQVGGFREGVAEDFDWCHRATAMGFALGYADDAVVGHPARVTWAQLVGKWRRLNAEAYALIRESSGGRLRWAARCLLLPVSALAHTPKVLLSKKLGAASERGGAVAVLWRLRWWRIADSLRLLCEGAPGRIRAPAWGESGRGRPSLPMGLGLAGGNKESKV